MTRRKKYIFLFSFCIFAFFVLQWAGKYQHNVGTSNFKLFNEHNLNGIIKEVGIKNHGSSIKLNNDSNVYVFYPDGEVFEKKGGTFQYFAKPGDSIIKKINADTLYLYKKDKILAFTFIKIIDNE